MKELLITGNSKILLMNDNGKLRLPTSEEIALSSDIETFDFQNYVAANLSEVTDLPEGSIVYGLRESWEILPPEKYTAATKGAELVNWSESEKFCSRDGEKLQRASQISKCCPRCGREYFPRLNPAIVVLVLKGSEALLVHAHTLKNPDVLTLVAGYVETGESLEECVRREIKEEPNLDVSDVKYFGSQAWPFPFQLMMGFTARYSGGELKFADGEITAGGFFCPDAMPMLPTMPSLSRVIIEEWRAGKFNSNS